MPVQSAPYRDEAVFESCDIVVVADDQAFVVDSRARTVPVPPGIVMS